MSQNEMWEPAFLIIWCRTCDDWVRVNINGDEFRCKNCDEPIAYWRDPLESKRAVLREMRAPK